MMVRQSTPAFFSVNSDNPMALYRAARSSGQARKKTLEEPGALDTLTASLTNLMRAQHLPVHPPMPQRNGTARRVASLPPSPPPGPAGGVEQTRHNSLDLTHAPYPTPFDERAIKPVPQPSSAPIHIVGRPHPDAAAGQMDSFALDEPRSVPMERSVSNAVSSPPTSYAPSRYLSCDYSECGSFRPGIDTMLGSPLSRRMSQDQTGRSRLLFADHLNQHSRPHSTERRATLDAWRSADMDPPNGAREDGTEHFAFLTDEDLQLHPHSGAHSPLRWPSGAEVAHGTQGRTGH